MLNRYKPFLKKMFHFAVLFGVLFSVPLQASLWHEIYQDVSFERINDAVYGDGPQSLLAVGENGAFYQSYDGGFSWETSMLPTSENLNCITAAEDYYSGQGYILIAAGDNGAVFKSSFKSGVWQPVDSLGSVNFTACVNDYGTIWLGGDQGALYNSRDGGLTWTNLTLADQDMNIKSMVSFSESIYFTAFKNDTSYLFDGYSTTPIDTLPGIEIFSSAVLYGNGERAYFLARDVNSGRNSVWQLEFVNRVQLLVVSADNPFEATSIGGYGKQYGLVGKTNKQTLRSDYTLWITSSNGQIWESTDDGHSWHVSFYDPEGRALSKVIGNSFDHDFGRAFGEGGLVVKEGFDLLYSFPGPNQNFISDFQRIELKFSHPVNLQSIADGVFIYSRLGGYMPFSASYDLSDSSRVFLELTNQEHGGYIPGDSWNLTLGGNIIPAYFDTTDFFKPFSYDVQLVSPRPSGFTFSAAPLSGAMNRSTTNFINALLDEDDVIDLATFSQDTLFVYSFSEDMQTQKQRKIFLTNQIQVYPGLNTQLLTTDVNTDGKPDIILYDYYQLFTFINTSLDSTLSFSVQTDPLSGEGFRGLAVFNGNDNEMPDMAVLDYSFYSIMDNTADNYGEYRPEIERTPPNYSRFELADLDRDGIVDMVLLNPNGQIVFRHGSGGGHFAAQNDSISLRSGYYEIQLADLDGDGELEVLALAGQQIDIYTLDENIGWNFYVNDAWTVYSPMQIVNFSLQELGGARQDNSDPRFDIVCLRTDSLVIYENQTYDRKQFHFVPVAGQSRALDIPAGQLLIADYNMDAFPDIAVLDKNLGQYEIFVKKTWQPRISDYNARRNRIYLQWDVPPADFGAVNYYRVFRDTTQDIRPEMQYRQVSENYLEDYEVDDYSAFWYGVQAVYEDGRESDLSEPVYIENFIILNGTQSASLDDSTRNYLAQSTLIVPSGDSLSILPGVRIGFVPQSGLEVFGKLRIQGGPEDNKMIDLFGDRKNEDFIPWNGIHIHPGEDTLSFEWFSVSDAHQGIFAEDRPLRMRYAGIIHNELGLEIKDDTLAARNMVFDSNMVAIKLSGGARAGMRNIDVLRSENSIIGADQSRMYLRNAIVWENMQPVSTIQPAAQISVSYSTVDSLAPGVNSEHISRIVPLFMPPDSGEFRPAYMSATIDAGDPQDDFSHEPMPNGGRINQGVFGGFFMATPSFQPRVSVFPKNISRSAFPGTADSFRVFIKNNGWANLNISAVNLPGEDNIFQVEVPFLTALPPNDSMSVKVFFRPQQRMTYFDTLYVTCDDPHLENGQRLIALQGTGMNTAPVIINEPARTVRAGELYQFQIEAQDRDGDSLFFSALQKPSWLSLSPTGLLSGSPANADSGLNRVQIVVSDPFEGTAVLDFNILVIRSLNMAVPTVSLTPLNKSIIGQAAVRFRFEVQDSTSEVMSDKRLRYTLVRVSLQDTLVLFDVDTTVISQVDFYPLEDGLYRFKVWAYRISTDAGINGIKAEKSWFSILASQRTVLPYRWHMVSFPREEAMQWSQFGYADSAAILLRWNQEQEEYEALDRNEILPGSAFWAMPLKELEFNLNAMQQTIPQGESFVEIHEGWNQVGIPIGYSLYWADMRFVQSPDKEMSLPEAVKDSLISPAVYWFSQTKEFQGYHWSVLDSSTVAWPWTGYWLKSNTEGMLFFPSQPAFENQNIVTPTEALAKRASLQQGDWSMSLTLQSSKYTDAQNIIGLSSKSSQPVFEPPHMGDFCTLYFPSRAGRLTRSIQPELASAEQVRAWNIRVSGRNLHKEHSIKWDKASLENAELYLYLVDEENETVVKMNEESGYSFELKNEQMRFKIYASKDESFRPEIIPLKYKLAQNFPNPFNPRTTIRFGLPESASAKKVELNIYNVLGKKVATLVNGRLKAGYHEVEWNGNNASGRQVASGIYFYQIRSGAVSLIKKMVLVR